MPRPPTASVLVASTLALVLLLLILVVFWRGGIPTADVVIFLLPLVLGGMCMLAPAAPVRLGRVSLVPNAVVAPIYEPCMLGTTGARMLAPSGALIRIGGGGPRGPYSCGSQCCSGHTGNMAGAYHCHCLSPEVFLQRPYML